MGGFVILKTGNWDDSHSVIDPSGTGADESMLHHYSTAQHQSSTGLRHRKEDADIIVHEPLKPGGYIHLLCTTRSLGINRGYFLLYLVGTDDGLGGQILMEAPVCLGLGLPGGVTPRSTARSLISKWLIHT